MAELKKQLRQERTQGWKKWVKEAEESNTKALYRLVRKTGPDYGKTKLEADPLHASIDERISFTRDVWHDRWKSEEKFSHKKQISGLAPITGDKVRRVIRHLSDNKVKGKDAWTIPELRAQSKADTDALAQFLNNVEKERRWPKTSWPHYCPFGQTLRIG